MASQHLPPRHPEHGVLISSPARLPQGPRDPCTDPAPGFLITHRLPAALQTTSFTPASGSVCYQKSALADPGRAPRYFFPICYQEAGLLLLAAQSCACRDKAAPSSPLLAMAKRSAEENRKKNLSLLAVLRSHCTTRIIRFPGLVMPLAQYFWGLRWGKTAAFITATK